MARDKHDHHGNCGYDINYQPPYQFIHLSFAQKVPITWALLVFFGAKTVVHYQKNCWMW